MAMLLRPRKHPRSADEPVSPGDIAESLLAMGLMAWMIASVPFFWFPQAWAIALMTPLARPRDAAAAPLPAALPAAAAVAALPPPRQEPMTAVPPRQATEIVPRQARPRRAPKRQA